MSHRLRRRVAAGLLVLAGVIVAGAAVWWLHCPEDLGPWRSGPPLTEWATLRRQEELWRKEGLHRRVESTYRPLSAVSEKLQLAVLVDEDIDFFGHGPFDVSAIREAVEQWREGRRLRGASTITQQLARTLFLSPERTLSRKAEEARLAWWIERRLSKRRILELYLNVVEFGPGLLGAEAASRHYYGVSAGALSSEEAAGLAAAIPAPGRDNPTTASRRWEQRRAIILVRMARVDWLQQRLRRLDEEQPGPGA